MTTVADVFTIARDPEYRQVADAIVLQECGPQLLQFFRATVRPQLLLTDGVVRSWRELADRTGLPKLIAKDLMFGAIYGMRASQLESRLMDWGRQERDRVSVQFVRDAADGDVDWPLLRRRMDDITRGVHRAFDLLRPFVGKMEETLKKMRDHGIRLDAVGLARVAEQYA